MTYMRSNRSVQALMKQVERSKLGKKKEIMMILEKSAAKSLALFEMEKPKQKNS